MIDRAAAQRRPLPRAVSRALVALAFAVLLGTALVRTNASTEAVTPTVMFVTQPPFGADFTTVNSPFGNQDGNTGATPRGGDLWIRYGDGTLRNLTAEAGFGLQTGQEIAVREPSVDWTGTKALFSMVIGGTTKNNFNPVYWQIYEVTGIGQGQAVHVAKLPQPASYNNVSPIYGTDDRIIFTSDRPRSGDRALYPQLDEYESQETVTGIWSMNPDGSGLTLLDHAVSGDFSPSIASDGRIIFTRWDHLQRDQQSDDGALPDYGAFNYLSESSAAKQPSPTEVYPEPRVEPAGSYIHPHRFNQFFPWMVNEDGTGLETLDHVGRHELLTYFDSAHDGLPEFFDTTGRRYSDSFLQIKEDPARPGYFYAVRAPEFATHGTGQIVGLNAPDGLNADSMQVDYVTDPATTVNSIPVGQPAPPDYPGRFRSPTPLSDGSMLAVQTTSPYDDAATGGPLTSRYDFRLVFVQRGQGYATPGARLIPNGISKSVSYWDNYSYTQLSYSGPLWELDPVEVRSRTRPARHANPLPAIENQILFEELGTQANVDRLRSWLAQHHLALITSRNVTRRADRQQDYNLSVPGGTQTVEPGATPVDVPFTQFFQGDQIRGYTVISTGGRRPIAQPMHGAPNPPAPGAPAGGVTIASDGSMAAFVPSARALTWQLTKADGSGVTRERYWVTFAAGEIRSCTNCHGINTTDTVLHLPPPTNPPAAFRDAVRWWRDNSANGTVGDTVGIYAPAPSAFFLRNSNGPGAADLTFNYGPASSGWTPLSGDWDGDGVDTPGFYNKATGAFFLKNTSAPGPADVVFIYGPAGANFVPLVGDWDNDGRDTVGLYDPATGAFFLRNFNAPGPADVTFVYGPPGAVPVAGDWDGDGGDSIGIYVPSTGAFFLKNTNAPGPADTTFVYGPAGSGWKPVMGDWNADNVDTVGLYDPATGTFFLRNSNSPGAADLSFSYGAPGATPLKGNWNGA